MLDKNSPQPLYEQIKHYILARIKSGEYAPHARLPSERKLSEHFEVSRLTVSKAVKQLVHEGLLYTQIGKGTYVGTTPIQQQIDTLTSFTEEMQTRGQTTSSRVLSATVKPASSGIAEILNIPVGTEVIELERIRMVAQRPMAIEQSTIIAQRCPNILNQHDFSHESLYAVLRENYNVLLVSAEQAFEAREATQHEARLLSIQTGAPVLAIHRVTYDDMNCACETVKSVYRGDSYKFRVKLNRI